MYPSRYIFASGYGGFHKALVAMVHPHNNARTDGTVLLHGVDDSDDSANKHLTHLSLAVDCCLMERSKQNTYAVGNNNNGVGNSVDDSDGERSKLIECVNGNKDYGVDNGVDNSVDDADKHLTHLSQANDCHLAERSKQIECVNDNKNNDVHYSVDDSNDGADKHITHLAQVDDCHLMERSKQIKCVDGDKDDGIGNSDDS
eukprot:10580360-Ditylum_brightwellii.AAC.1